MKIILASKSKVRKDILTEHNINCEIIHSNVDEDPIKDSLIAEGATPEIVSKNLAELKANKVSSNSERFFIVSFALSVWFQIIELFFEMQTELIR